MVKIVNIDKAPTQNIGDRGHSIKLVNKDMGSEILDVHINTLKPGIPGVYHYHEKIENVYIPIKGKGRLVVNGNEYIIEKGVVVFLKPGDKHEISAFGDEEFSMFEIYSSIERDYIPVEKE
jgi:mannose-6-phosphate isomerase-like protein (cupin superfamily)